MDSKATKSDNYDGDIGRRRNYLVLSYNCLKGSSIFDCKRLYRMNYF